MDKVEGSFVTYVDECKRSGRITDFDGKKRVKNEVINSLIIIVTFPRTMTIV